jgi:hypothetical protein
MLAVAGVVTLVAQEHRVRAGQEEAGQEEILV